jgi:hypothetical protein
MILFYAIRYLRLFYVVERFAQALCSYNDRDFSLKRGRLEADKVSQHYCRR